MLVISIDVLSRAAEFNLNIRSGEVSYVELG